MPLYVTSGKYFDDRRNTSQARAPDPNSARDLKRMCDAARARGEPWIQWIDAGCPELTVEEYERVSTFKRKRRG